jgi:hypothetical protein
MGAEGRVQDRMGTWIGKGVQDGNGTCGVVIENIVIDSPMEYNGKLFSLFNCHKLRKICVSISYRIQ